MTIPQVLKRLHQVHQLWKGQTEQEYLAELEDEGLWDLLLPHELRHPLEDRYNLE